MSWYKITCEDTVKIVSKGFKIKSVLGYFHEWEEGLIEAEGPASAVKTWLEDKYGDTASYEGTLVATKFNFPKEFYEHTEHGLRKVYFNGELVFTWNNEANQDYPEDLTWERDIGAVFREAYQLGLKHGRNVNEF